MNAAFVNSPLLSSFVPRHLRFRAKFMRKSFYSRLELYRKIYALKSEDFRVSNKEYTRVFKPRRIKYHYQYSRAPHHNSLKLKYFYPGLLPPKFSLHKENGLKSFLVLDAKLSVPAVNKNFLFLRTKAVDSYGSLLKLVKNLIIEFQHFLFGFKIRSKKKNKKSIRAMLYFFYLNKYKRRPVFYSRYKKIFRSFFLRRFIKAKRYKLFKNKYLKRLNSVNFTNIYTVYNRLLSIRKNLINSYFTIDSARVFAQLTKPMSVLYRLGAKYHKIKHFNPVISNYMYFLKKNQFTNVIKKRWVIITNNFKRPQTIDLKFDLNEYFTEREIDYWFTGGKRKKIVNGIRRLIRLMKSTGKRKSLPKRFKKYMKRHRVVKRKIYLQLPNRVANYYGFLEKRFLNRVYKMDISKTRYKRSYVNIFSKYLFINRLDAQLFNMHLSDTIYHSRQLVNRKFLNINDRQSFRNEVLSAGDILQFNLPWVYNFVSDYKFFKFFRKVNLLTNFSAVYKPSFYGLDVMPTKTVFNLSLINVVKKLGRRYSRILRRVSMSKYSAMIKAIMFNIKWALKLQIISLNYLSKSSYKLFRKGQVSDQLYSEVYNKMFILTESIFRLKPKNIIGMYNNSLKLPALLNLLNSGASGLRAARRLLSGIKFRRYKRRHRSRTTLNKLLYNKRRGKRKRISYRLRRITTKIVFRDLYANIKKYLSIESLKSVRYKWAPRYNRKFKQRLMRRIYQPSLFSVPTNTCRLVNKSIYWHLLRTRGYIINGWFTNIVAEFLSAITNYCELAINKQEVAILPNILKNIEFQKGYIESISNKYLKAKEYRIVKILNSILKLRVRIKKQHRRKLKVRLKKRYKILSQKQNKNILKKPQIDKYLTIKNLRIYKSNNPKNKTKQNINSLANLLPHFKKDYKALLGHRVDLSGEVPSTIIPYKEELNRAYKPNHD